MSELVRIGGRLFNLLHVTAIEPEWEGQEVVVDIHIIPGRTVRLRGEDARSAIHLVETYPAFPAEPSPAEPPDQPGPGPGAREVADEVPPDRAVEDGDADGGRASVNG